MRLFPMIPLAALLLTSVAGPALSQTRPATPPPPAPAETKTAPLADLVKAVDIPYEKFVLKNGLTVLIHTDRKSPIVGVTLYYRVGSRHEPRGKTGFAHLYEHLFFGGSENAPNFDVPLESAGSTSTNGSTWYDRTNYVETVPSGALDLALFLESDRMGHLLGAVTQDKLDKQRGVVQNEKRQGDNEPYGLLDYTIGDGLFPVGHPYRHSTIGSMADLDAASLGDVRQWFKDNYAPNNVVLSLAGDIDAATARPLVEKWFGDIKRGPAVRAADAQPVTLAAPVKREMTDQVPLTRVTRNWSGPGLNDADTPALKVGLHILGGLASSRLDNVLVRGEQLAVQVTASDQIFEKVSFLQATMDIKPGVDRAKAEARLDALIAQYLAEGPSEDEVRRAATSIVSSEIGALEYVGGFSGKGANLAEGQLYSNDPAHYRAELTRIAALTPADVKRALNKWMSRPVLAVAVTPGERTEKGETMGGWGDEATTPAPAPDAKAPAPALPASPPRTAPPIAQVGELAFPKIERAKLSNGIPIAVARRTAVPKVSISLTFDAGYSADALDTPGTQTMLLEMLDEGTTSRSAIAIAEEQERLGASIATNGGIDTSTVQLTALTANLAPSLALLADVARNPAFADSEVARVKDQQLAELSQAIATPRALAQRELGKLLFGPAHPYGQPTDGLGDAKSLAALTPAALRTAQGKWLRPDGLRITVVGDVTLEQVQPLLEQAFGDWKAPATPRPAKNVAAAIPQARPRIVLLDRPNSPQSVIVAGRVLSVTGRTPDLEALGLANEVLGDGFLSRLNLDLREDKGWSYGVRTAIRTPIGPRSLFVVAPVQSDRTGDSIKLILADMKAFPATKPVDAAELNRVTDGNVRALPNSFETNAQVLAAINGNELLGRPDDYYQTLPARYRAIDAKALDGAAKTYLGGEGLTFVVVGDRKVVEPQLKDLGLPVEFGTAPAAEAGNE